MQASAASLTSARRPLAGQQAGPRPGRVAAGRPPRVRCAAGKQEANDPKMEGLRDKAAVFLTGLAATCLVSGDMASNLCARACCWGPVGPRPS